MRSPLLIAALLTLLVACAVPGPRQLSVSPTQLTLSERISSRSVSVRYDGPLGTHTTIRAVASNERLEVVPTIVTVAAGRTVTIEVRGDFAALAGTLGATIRLESSQPATDAVIEVVLAPLCFIDPDAPMQGGATIARTSAVAPVASTSSRAAHVPGELLVSYRAFPARAATGASDAVARVALTNDVAATAGVSVLRRGSGHAHDLVRVIDDDLDAAAARLRSDPRVEFVARNYVAERLAVPPDEHYGAQWYLSEFGLEAAWSVEDASEPGTDVIIAVIDDGLNVDHVDLRSKTLPGRDVYCDDDDVRTFSDHGSHVAGIAAAGSSAEGLVVGVAKGERARLVAVKVFPDNVEMGGTLDSVIRGMRWAGALDGGDERPAADVINLSLGFGTSLSEGAIAILQATVDAIHAEGILMVAASGNTFGGGGVTYPARLARVVGVGSVDWEFTRSRFSTFGAGLDLMAPGGTAPLAAATDPVCASGTLAGDRHAVVGAGAPGTRAIACLTGTSMASPFVAGTAALLIASNEGYRGEPDAIVERLAASAHRPPDYSVEQYGFGIVCPDAALGLATTCTLEPGVR
ncbi:hypothetical protein BH23DEI1_BH23DEI1_06850 [soil metagenome]